MDQEMIMKYLEDIKSIMKNNEDNIHQLNFKMDTLISGEMPKLKSSIEEVRDITTVNAENIKRLEHEMVDKEKETKLQFKSIEDKMEDIEKKIEKEKVKPVVSRMLYSDANPDVSEMTSYNPSVFVNSSGNKEGSITVDNRALGDSNVSSVKESLDVIRTSIEIAKSKIGLNPIDLDHIRKFSKDKNSTDIEAYNNSDNDESRLKAAQEFLEYELKFDPNEIEIFNTKIATKKEARILWITTTKEAVKKIFKRAGTMGSRLRERRVNLYNFFPRELWARKLSLDSNCRKARMEDSKLRTQVRLGETDIQLYTKYVEEPFWRKTPNEQYGELSPVGSNIEYSPPRNREIQLPNKRQGSPLENNDNSKKTRETSPKCSTSNENSSSHLKDDFYNTSDEELKDDSTLDSNTNAKLNEEEKKNTKSE